MRKPTTDNRAKLAAKPDDRARASSWLIVLAGASLIAGIALWAYLPALTGGFIWDDEQLLVKNNLVKAPDGLYRMWFTKEPIDFWPLTYSTFWIEWRLWGMDPTGYHVTNLLLHIAAAFLLWAILRKRSIPGAFLAALLFAVHPVNVESVAWIAQRKNTLAMVFFLLSILWYLRAGEWQIKNTKARSVFGIWYGMSLLAFALAMLSKGSVAILPLLLLLLVWWQRRRISLSDFVNTIPFFVLAGALTAVNIWFQTHGTGQVIRTVGPLERLAGAGTVVWFYLSKALLPIDLLFVYPQWQIVAANLLWWLPLIAGAIVTALLWSRRNSPHASWQPAVWFAWIFFCVALVPVLGLTDVYFMKYSLVADHYEYIALLAVVSLVAAGWSRWHQSAREALRWLPICAAAIGIGALALSARQQSGIYKDAVAVYESTLEENPTCWMAHNNLGLELVKISQPLMAMQHYQQALVIRPDYPEAHNNLGIVLRDSGQLPESIEHFRQALQLNPAYVDAHTNLGIAYVLSRQLPSAIEEFKEAARINPYSAEAFNNLGGAMRDSGRTEEAIGYFKQAVALRPTYLDAHFNLGHALRQSGRYDEALQQYFLALQISPNDPAIYAMLTKTYADMNRPADAIATAEKALQAARSQGRAELIQQIETWLANYRWQQSKP